MAKLHFYYSAMNAGKTTTLLQSAYNYNERGMDVLLFTTAMDDRYEVGTITSRIGLQQKAIVVDNDFNFFDYVSDAIKKNPNICCILVDEVHFMTKKQMQQLTQITTQLNKPVLAYGLRSDFRGEPFESTRYLLAWAEELIEIKTICHCGRKATMNMRIDEHGNKVSEGASLEVGGNDRYVSVCRKHYDEGKSGVGDSK
ncbi:MAG: thymidine kinase [Gammaproteobacteria bacterium]|jgi:thymidine kinase